MKKIISAIMTLTMIFGLVAMAIPASASVEVDEIAEYIDYVEAYYFASAPKIDGVITTDEWGAPTVEVDSVDAATVEDNTPNNKFFYARGDGGADTKLYYKLWLRWDENYFYIGAQVTDPDGHSLKRGRNETWNGDALQVRVDPYGPNAVLEGETWADIGGDNKPWSAEACDLVFGYANLGGGFSEAYDNKAVKGMTSSANNPLGTALVAIVPCGTNYSSDSGNGITTYELAVPWGYIETRTGYSNTKTYTEYSESRKNPNFDGGIGRQFGISAEVYNSNNEIKFTNGNNKDLWNCFLSWGSGVDAMQGGSPEIGFEGVAVGTIAGSNSVVLSDEKVNSVPTNYTEGGIPERTGLNFNVPGVDGLEVWENLTFDDEADLDIWGGYSGGTRVQLDDGNWVVKWDRWDSPDTGEKDVLQDNNYLTTETGDGIAGHGGTWSETWTYNTSFTFEFDVMVTGTEPFADGYESALYNWFGGPNQVDYMCGYFFNQGKFLVTDKDKLSDATILAEKTADFTPNVWHHWRFQYDNPSCTMRLYFDDNLIFNFYNKYFDLTEMNEQVMMIFRRMNVQIMMDNIKITNFVDYSPSETPETVDPSGGGASHAPASTEVREEAGGTAGHEGKSYWVDLPYRAEYGKATSLYFDVKFDSSKFTFVNVTGIDEKAIKVEQMGDGYYRVTVTNLGILKNMTAGSTLFRVNYTSNDGVEVTDEDMAALASNITAVRVSPNTGDAMMIIAIVAAAVMVMGTAIVVTKKKSYNVD